MNTVLLLARTMLALVLLTAGTAKIARPAGTRDMLREFGVPLRLTPLLAWLLPLAELGLGAALLPMRSARWGAAGALVLFLLFLTAIAWNLSRGRRPNCRCFGQVASRPIGWKLVGRNLVLSGLAGLVLVQPAPAINPVALRWLDLLGPDRWGALALIVALAACLAATVGMWLTLQLVGQHGRLLLRMDALESRLLMAEGFMPAPPPVHPPIRAPSGRALAPDFALPDLQGRMVTLGGLRASGRPVLLLFMDPGCGPCTALIPEIEGWRRRLSHSLTIVVLSRGTLEVNRHLTSAPNLGRVLLADDEIVERYHALGTPAAVLVDAEGRLMSAVAQGAGAIRELVAGATAIAPAPFGAPRRAAATAMAGGVAVVTFTLLGSSTSPWGSEPPPVPSGWVLEIEGHNGWTTWWRSDSPPGLWDGPLNAVAGATRWRTVAGGVEAGELVISGGSLALRTRVVLARFDPSQNETVLVGTDASSGGPATWTIDSAGPEAVVAFNAGQFRNDSAWGWLIRDGRELQPPGRGPLSMAVVVTTQGSTRFVPPDSIQELRHSGVVSAAFQSYPALLVDQGRVPDRLMRSTGRVDLSHRDARLSLCTLYDGRILVALTRFDNLGRVFGAIPIGLTLDETAALMGALGCRRAVSLDGGISAQLLVRPRGGPVSRWAGNRMVPLGIEIRPRS